MHVMCAQILVQQLFFIHWIVLRFSAATVSSVRAQMQIAQLVTKQNVDVTFSAHVPGEPVSASSDTGKFAKSAAQALQRVKNTGHASKALETLKKRACFTCWSGSSGRWREQRRACGSGSGVGGAGSQPRRTRRRTDSPRPTRSRQTCRHPDIRWKWTARVPESELKT